MIGLGAVINAVAVVLGSAIGILFRKGLKENMQSGLMSACGVAVMFIGMAGTLEGMLSVNNGSIESGESLLLVFSLTIGTILGELIDIEKHMDELGEKVKKLFRAENDSRFVDGFVTTSLIICIGAMAIVGSIEDGLNGDISTLTAKAVIDFVIVIVLASTYGIGVMCSAIPLLVYEEALTVAAHFAGNFISSELIGYLSYVGSALIFCVGVNTVFGKKFRVGNMLPSMLIPVFYTVLF